MHAGCIAGWKPLRFPVPWVERCARAAYRSGRLRPVFRDDDEMAASGPLDDRLRAAIDESAAMVLLASPAAADSPYVNEEVAHFVQTHGTDRLAIVAMGGEQHRLPRLPSVLREVGQELLWVDCRGGRSLTRRSLVRIAATVLDINFDLLWQRHRRRRQTIANWVAGVLIVVATFGTVLWQQQRSADERTPARQQANFESYISAEILKNNREFNPNLVPTT